MTTATQTCPFISPADRLTRAAQIAGAVRLADIQPIPTKWLWPGKIPLGRITLLVSDPGLGKSLLTLDIAARVSTGAPWPDHKAATGGRGSASGPRPSTLDPGPAASVLLLTSEDDLADTIRPRLQALGADCDKILAISHIPGENPDDVPRAFALNRDLKRLVNLLDAMPDCRLVVIDPISAFLDGTHEQSNADVRTLFATLTTIARERDIAVLVVSHLRKKEGSAIHRVMGSLAFTAGARAAWAICNDPTNENRRLFLPLKNNLAPTACQGSRAGSRGGLAFSIESHNGAPTIRWSPEPVVVSTDNTLGLSKSRGRPDNERQDAVDWLQERLATGARPVSDLKEESDAFGISYRTLRRAFRELHGEAARQGIPPLNRWVWKLPQTPETTGQNSGEELWPTNYLNDIVAELAKPWTPKPTATTKPRAP
jgi:hypothetical protein